MASSMLGHEDLAVADTPGLRRAPDRVDCLLDQIIRDHDLDFNPWQKITMYSAPRVEFGVTLLPPENPWLRSR